MICQAAHELLSAPSSLRLSAEKRSEAFTSWKLAIMAQFHELVVAGQRAAGEDRMLGVVQHQLIYPSSNWPRGASQYSHQPVNFLPSINLTHHGLLRGRG